MKRLPIIFAILLAIIAPRLAAEQWRLHPTYAGYVNRIIDTRDYTYVISRNQPYASFAQDIAMKTNSLFRYDKKGDEVTWLNISNRLSSPTVITAEYSYDGKFLLVAYNDGNIDLLYDDGNTLNIPGFKSSDATLSRNVNSITFGKAGDDIYLATDFGYITVDESKGEIGTSRMLDRQLKAAVKFDGKIFMLDADGLCYIDPASTDPNRLTAIEGTLPAERLFVIGDRLYMFGGEGWYGTLRYVTAGTDYTPQDAMVSYINAVERIGDSLLVSAYNFVWTADAAGNTVYLPKAEADYERQSISCDGKTFWIDFGLKGIVAKVVSGDGAQWTANGKIILPDAAQCFKSTSMDYSSKYGMLVRNHGIDWNFTNVEPGTPDYISGLKGLTWTPLSVAARLPENTSLTLNHPNGLAIDPRNPDHVYCGSILDGLLRLDLSDPSRSIRIGRVNDPAAGDKNFAALTPVQEAWSKMSSFGSPAFDNNGNLWVTFFNVDQNSSGKGAELWCWTPEDRAASTTAANLRPFRKILLDGDEGSNLQHALPLRSQSNKNVIVFSTSGSDKTFVLLNHNGTPDTTTDDVKVKFPATVYDQDGSALSNAYYLCMFEDTSTGNVWVGTDDGVFYFNPQNVMKNISGMRVNRVKVARNDGTQLADYLLAGAKVNQITTDPSGRKWFATHGGGVVVTSSTGAEVIRTYTSDNSMLPDNTVYGICYNPENNSMMISTDAGLAELYLSGAAGDSAGNGDAVVYPNPVRPDYYGYVTIEGLEDGALVKITDSGGNLIKELGFAEGGTARWDVTNLNNKRVRSGVYYVLASGGPDSSGFSAAAKIVVVN